MNTAELKECREAFEAWSKENNIPLAFAVDGKTHPYAQVEAWWKVWQAAWSRRPASVPKTELEIIRVTIYKVGLEINAGEDGLRKLPEGTHSLYAKIDHQSDTT